MTTTTRTDWIKRYYELCETDIDAAMEFWAPTGQLRFANFEPLVGRETIRESFKQWVHMWAEERHTLLDVWELPDDGMFVFELAVAFRMHDGEKFNVRGAAVCRVENEQYLDQRIYVDLGEVWAAAKHSAASATSTAG